MVQYLALSYRSKSDTNIQFNQKAVAKLYIFAIFYINISNLDTQFWYSVNIVTASWWHDNDNL